MIAFLRFIGVMNASVWFGAVVVFSALISPALASPELLKLFTILRTPVEPVAYAHLVGEIVVERFYLIHYICGSIGAFHLLLEWLYTGKGVRLFMVYIMLTLTALGLINGLVLNPKMKQLHRIHYGVTSTPAQQAQAGKMFQVLNTTTQIIHWVMVGGLLIYTWKTASPGEQPRFSSTRKFRG